MNATQTYIDIRSLPSRQYRQRPLPATQGASPGRGQLEVRPLLGVESHRERGQHARPRERHPEQGGGRALGDTEGPQGSVHSVYLFLVNKI